MLGTLIGIFGILTSVWLQNWLAASWALAFTFMAEASRINDKRERSTRRG